jgi:hypothetical protein
MDSFPGFEVPAPAGMTTASDAATLRQPSARRHGACEDLRMNPLRDNPFNAPLAEGVGRVGFRKWYERELLSSHAHMVLAFLGLIGVFASLEAARSGTLGEKLVDTLLILVSAAITLWALRRYLFLLARAEVVANQAQCTDCGEYGRFRVVADHRESSATDVCCRKCQHQWTINTGD